MRSKSPWSGPYRHCVRDAAIGLVLRSTQAQEQQSVLRSLRYRDWDRYYEDTRNARGFFFKKKIVGLGLKFIK